MVYQYLGAAGVVAAVAVYKHLKDDGQEDSDNSETSDDGDDRNEDDQSRKVQSHQVEEDAEPEPKEDKIDRIDISSKESEEEVSRSQSTTDKKRFSAGVKESKISHEEAQERDPPVELGGSYKVVPEKETFHHSGQRNLMARYFGFRIFINDPPDDVNPGDKITVTITSFARNGNAAQGIVAEEK